MPYSAKKTVLFVAISFSLLASCSSNSSRYVFKTNTDILKLEKISSTFVKGDIVGYDDYGIHDDRLLFVLSSSKLAITTDCTRTKAIGSYDFKYIPAQCFVKSEPASYDNNPTWNVVTTHYNNNSEIMDYYLFSILNNKNGSSVLSVKKMLEVPVDCNKILHASFENKSIVYQSKSKQAIYTLNMDTLKIARSDLAKPREFFYTYHNVFLWSYDDRYIYENSFDDKSKLCNLNIIDTFQNNPVDKMIFNLSPEFNYTAIGRLIPISPVLCLNESIISTYIGVGIRMKYDGLFRNTSGGQYVSTSEALYFIDSDSKSLVRIEDKPSLCLAGSYGVSFVLVFEDGLYKLKAYSCDPKTKVITITDLDYSRKNENVTAHIDLEANMYLYSNDGVYKVNFNNLAK